MTPDQELAWLAGLLEGEGTFFTVRSQPAGCRRSYFYPLVALGMTDADVVARVAGIFGVGWRLVSNTRGKKKYYRTVATGSRAANIMRAILPFMGERRAAKIREVLAAYDSRPRSGNTRASSCALAAHGRLRNERGVFVRTVG